MICWFRLLNFASEIEMPEYSYPCPSAYYSGSANCVGICVFVPVVDTAGVFKRWRQCCGGCPPGWFCDEPSEGRDFFSMEDAVALMQEGEGFHTQCVNSLLGTASLFKGVPDAIYGFIRVQSVDDPATSFGPTRLNLAGDEKQIELGGWIVTFTRLRPAGNPIPENPNAQIHPPQTPMAGFELSDQFRTATVVLPESSGLNQYIVTVPESSNDATAPYKYGLLRTRDWQVHFQRAPISPALAPALGETDDCCCC
jgi:hypothetical protein